MGEAFPIALCDSRHGPLLVPADDAVIGRAIALYGQFAEAVPRLLCSALAPGDTAVDVGANIGTVALPLARAVGPSGRVYAFEPQRRAHALLGVNAALNGLSQLVPIRAGLAAAAGMMVVPSADAPDGGNQGAVALAAEGPGDPVPVIPLDALDLPACALIKIDVEGMEAAVLAGAAGTIARHRPILYAEAHPGPGTMACLSWLAAAGYRCHWHISPFWDADNIAGARSNVFGDRGDVNVLALPAEAGLSIDLPPVSGADADWRADIERWAAARQAPSPGR